MLKFSDIPPHINNAKTNVELSVHEMGIIFASIGTCLNSGTMREPIDIELANKLIQKMKDVSAVAINGIKNAQWTL